MILYLGNNLTLHGNTPSSIETLGKLLGERYTVKRFSSRKNQVARWMDMMFAVVRYRRTTGVVLIDTYSSRAFFYALGAAVLCRWLTIPYIPILRGGNLQMRLNNSPGFSRYLFQNAHTLIAPSGYLFSVFRESGFANVLYIPNSIEVSAYVQKSRKTFRPKLLWVRSFHEVYNPAMAIDVLHKLTENFADAELCMVGPDKDGTLLRCKNYACELGLQDKIKFTGVLPKADWHSVANGYDIFINTTTVDNTPVSVIEAMALGLPIVSTNVGGMPYLIRSGENGLLVNSSDVDHMVSQIIFLVQHPEKAQQLSSEARRQVEQFDWQQVKQQWFKLLDKFNAVNA